MYVPKYFAARKGRKLRPSAPPAGRRTLLRERLDRMVSLGISGGDVAAPPAPGAPGAPVPTLTELRDQRATVANQIDDILNTARQANRSELTEEERTNHDQLETRFTELTEQIRAAESAEDDAERFRRQGERHRIHAPNINRITTPPPSANRSLDELLWASPEDVEAGHITPKGFFVRNRYGARNSIEQVVVRNDEQDLALAPRMEEFLPEHHGAIRMFQRTVSDMVLFGLMVDKDAKNSRDGFETARRHKKLKDRWQASLRALDVDTAAEGGDWVPTGIGMDLHALVRAAGKVAPLFNRVDLPTNPWRWPIEGADATAYRVAEPTTDTATKVTASTPGTKKAEFDAEIFGGRILFSRSVEPDSALAILPFTRGKLARAFVDAEEKAILDGDSDGTHQDTDVTGTTDARTAWDGLRKKGKAETSKDALNVAATLALFRDTRKLMKKWGLNPADLAIIVPVIVYYQLLALSEVTTLEKYGQQATILNGELGRLDGVPIVVSEHGREDLAATGFYDGTTVNRTYLLIVNRGEWAMGQRMALDVEVDDSIYRETFQRVVVAFMREDFQNIGDASTNEDTGYLYNIAS
jgi:predicted phage gp36 major capsid-like protein